MPLIKGKSPQSVGQNIKTEMAAGKPRAQSIAIALNTARQAGAKIPKPRPARKPVTNSLNRLMKGK
jgi:hypothetical protein